MTSSWTQGARPRGTDRPVLLHTSTTACAPHTVKSISERLTRIKMQTRQVLSMFLVLCFSVTRPAPSPADRGSGTPGAEGPEVELPVRGQQECLG